MLDYEPQFLKLNPSYDLVRVPEDGFAVEQAEPVSLRGQKRELYLIPQGERFAEIDPFAEDRYLLDFVGYGATPSTRRQGVVLDDAQLLGWCNRYGTPETELVVTGDGRVLPSMSLRRLHNLQRSVATAFNIAGIVRRGAVEELREMVDPRACRVKGLPPLHGDLIRGYIDRRAPMTASLDDRRLVIAGAVLQRVLNENMQGSIRLLWDGDNGGYTLRFVPSAPAAVLWLRIARFLAGEEAVAGKGKQKRFSTLERCAICGCWDFGLSEYKKGELKGERYHPGCYDSSRVTEWRAKKRKQKDASRTTREASMSTT